MVMTVNVATEYYGATECDFVTRVCNVIHKLGEQGNARGTRCDKCCK